MTTTQRLGPHIWALSIATFINRATGFLGLFAAVFFSEIRLTPETLVSGLLAVGVAGVCGSLLGGQLADRLGKLPVLTGSTVINVGLYVSLALIDYSLTVWVVALSATSVLVSQAFIGPASALVAESAQGRERVTRFAFYRIFINVGSIVAPALVGLVGREHFDLLFWFSATGSVIVPFVLLAGRSGFTSSQKRTHDENTVDAPSEGDNVPVSARTWASPLVYAAMALAMLVYAQHQSAVPLRLETEPQGVQLYALLLIINPVIVILVEYPLSYLTKRMPAHTALSLGVIIMGLGVAITGSFADITAIAIAGWVLFSVGECIFAPMSNSYVAELSGAAAQGRAQGRLAAFQSTGAAMGPGLGSWLLFALQGGAWAAFLVLTLISAALVVTAHRAHTQATRRFDDHLAH